MPARHQSLTVNPGAAVALTDGAVAAVRVHNPGTAIVELQATATAAAPTSRAGAVLLRGGETLAADLTLAALFPGVGTGALFLWAFAPEPVDLSVSHA